MILVPAVQDRWQSKDSGLTAKPACNSHPCADKLNSIDPGTSPYNFCKSQFALYFLLDYFIESIYKTQQYHTMFQ